MAVHRVGKTLLIDELNAPLFFGEMVKVNRKDRLHGSRVQVWSHWKPSYQATTA